MRHHAPRAARCGSAGTRVISAPVAWRIAFRIAGAVGISDVLAQALGAEGAFGVRHLDQDGFRSGGTSPKVGIR